jgi:hypothetical protein
LVSSGGFSFWATLLSMMDLLQIAEPIAASSWQQSAVILQ